VGASEVDVFEAAAGDAFPGLWSKGGEWEGFGFEINRYRIGDAFIRSCAADSEANSARNVFGEGVRGLYCQLSIVSKALRPEG
jgi:hypothetical protein